MAHIYQSDLYLLENIFFLYKTICTKLYYELISLQMEKDVKYICMLWTALSHHCPLAVAFILSLLPCLGIAFLKKQASKDK